MTNHANNASLDFALKVLVVEDNDTLREVTITSLQKRGHYVRGVPSAEDVNDVTGGFVPDVYVIDLGLPDEDGLTLTRRLRASQPNAGIVIATARSQIGERVLGYQSGADIYLTKPVHPDELGAAVASIGARLYARRHPTDSIMLSVARLRLTGPKGCIELGPGETAVLSALARAPGRTLERWQIAEVISGDNRDLPSAATIEMRITRLRRKLAQVGAEQPSIKALHGMGYALCCAVVVE